MWYVCVHMLESLFDFIFIPLMLSHVSGVYILVCFGMTVESTHVFTYVL